MPDEVKRKALIDKELETLELLLWGDSMRGAVSIQEFVNASLAQGVSRETIKAALTEDLNTGGRIFGEFRKAIRATGNGSINRFRDVTLYEELGTDKQKYRWVAILVNTCIDCEERHGKIKSWENWEEIGLPRAEQTVCKQWCRCVLLPAESTELEPIKRERKA